MKKLLVLVMVLAMASLANATIIIQVDGQQTTDPESPINVMNGQVVTLGLYAQEEQGYFERLLGVTIDGTSEGAGGTFDLSAAVLDYKGDLSSLTLIDDPIGLFVGQVITTTFNDSADPPKTVIGQLASS